MINQKLHDLLYNDFVLYNEKIAYYFELSNGDLGNLNSIPALFHTPAILLNIFHQHGFTRNYDFENQDDDYFLELISYNAKFIKYKKEMSLDFIKKALAINGAAIVDIPENILRKNKDLLFKIAIDQNPQNFHYCNKPSQELIRYIISIDVDLVIRTTINSKSLIRDIVRYFIINKQSDLKKLIQPRPSYLSYFGEGVRKMLACSKTNNLSFNELLILDSQCPILSQFIHKSKNFRHAAKGILEILEEYKVENKDMA